MPDITRATTAKTEFIVEKKGCDVDGPERRNSHPSNLQAHILSLQRIVGNRAVTSLARGGNVPTTLQRAPKTPPPPKLPTLSTAQTGTFFVDLNAAIFKVMGIQPSLGSADFSIKPPAEFAAYAAKDARLSGYYREAEVLASSMCSAALNSSMCGTDAKCLKELKRVKADPARCSGGKATDKFIGQIMTIKGITPATGQSVVMERTTSNLMLLAIIHEAIHRLRGVIWRRRSRSGEGYVHSRTRDRLNPIGDSLDEGTTQLMTDLVIAQLQRLKGRSWFKGYTPNVYRKEVAVVNDILAKHGKNVDFLRKAFTGNSDATEVEDLQLWQDQR